MLLNIHDVIENANNVSKLSVRETDYPQRDAGSYTPYKPSFEDSIMTVYIVAFSLVFAFIFLIGPWAFGVYGLYKYAMR